MRHPLAELSLEKFLHLNQRSSTKRSLSPTASLLSPTKRRLLTAEGFYSPEKKRQRTSLDHFSDYLGSPPSPARRLNFAALTHPSPRNSGAKFTCDASPRPETPVSLSNIVPKLQPSPTIASNLSNDASWNDSREEALDIPYQCHPPALMLIPREMPAFADRQSMHWPGFDVHPDTYITIPTSKTSVHSSNTTGDPLDDAKENIRPRKRVGKRPAYDEVKSAKPSKIGKTERRVQDSELANIMSIVTSSPNQRTIPAPQDKSRRTKQLRLIMETETKIEENAVEDQL